MARVTIEQLKGKTVLDAGVMEGVPILCFEDGTVAEIWADAEGNGPGHLEVYDEADELEHAFTGHEPGTCKLCTAHRRG